MKSKKEVQRSVAATFVALIAALGIFAMVSPVQAQVTSVLYAGGSDPGYVYKYTGGTTWDVISPDFGFAVLDLVAYDGHLYAGIKSSSGTTSGEVKCIGMTEALLGLLLATIWITKSLLWLSIKATCMPALDGMA